MSAPPDIFLSYSREDQIVARLFAQGLEREGISVWWDQTLTAGEAFDEVTEKALQGARAVVVLWSKHAVASRWVRAEAAQADENGTLVPVLIEPCNVPIKFKLTQTADLAKWKGEPGDPSWQAFVAGLRPLVGKDAAAGIAAVNEAPARARPPQASRTGLLIASAIALLALVGGGAWLLGRGNQGPEPAAAPALAQSGPASIAVLPFVDLSSAKDQEYFADGVTEEILNSLARISDLRVTGRTSSFYFKGRNEKLTQIAEQLGVDYVLEGSVRKDADQLRITAQLIKAADGFHLWSRTYDRSTQDIFGIQEDIARSVANTLQIALGVGDLGQLPGMTRDAQAYEAWLAGRSEMRKITLEGYQRAAQHLEAAVQRDPSFILGWLDLSSTYRLIATFLAGDPASIPAIRQKAEATRAEALRMNPDDVLLKLVSRMDEASAAGLVAVAPLWKEFDPVMRRYNSINLGGVSASSSQWLVAVDKSSETIGRLEEDRLQDPLDPAMLVYLSEAYANTGRLKEALAQQEYGLQKVPNELLATNRLMSAAGSGDPAQVRAAWTKLMEITSDELTRNLYPLRDRPAEARALLRRLAAERPGAVAASRMALWAAYFGDPELALQALQADRDLARRRITSLALWRPVMRDVRQLPGFKTLVKDWGFVEYWRQFGWGDHCKPIGEEDFECR